MSLPVTKQIPAAIKAYTDPTGNLPASTLWSVPKLGKFEVQAARSLNAMLPAAAAAGITIRSVGAYRSYAQQVILFEQRYSPNAHTGRCYSWKGQRWCLKPGAAGAAYPGTSNHGLGLANDFAELINGQIVTLSFDPPGAVPSLWTWLHDNGPSFGWYWGEAPSEAWHWVYCAGDHIPARVLAFEHPQPPPPPPPPPLPVRVGSSQEDEVPLIVQVTDKPDVGHYLLGGVNGIQQAATGDEVNAWRSFKDPAGKQLFPEQAMTSANFAGMKTLYTPKG